MKALRHMVRSIEQWRQLQRKVDRVARTKGLYPPTSRVAPSRLGPNQRPPIPIGPCRGLRRRRPVRHPRVFFAVSALALTAVVGQRFYNQPELQVDTQAPETIVAPADALVTDEQSTEEKRRAARNGVLRVLTLDGAANEAIEQNLNNLFQQATGLRRQAGPFPFAPTYVLSTATQRFLRSASQEDWEAIEAALASMDQADANSNLANLLIQARNLTPAQRQVAKEIWTYRQRSTPEEQADLEDSIDSARRLYQQARANLTQAASRPVAVPNDPRLLELTDAEWRATQTALRQGAQRMIVQGIMPGLPNELRLRAVQAQLDGTLPSQAEPLAVQILNTALQPNLIEDSERTRLQAEMAAEAVEPVTVAVSAGEVIVAAGEPITQGDFVLLDHFGLSQRRLNWSGLTGFALLVGTSIGGFLLVERRWHGRLRQQDYLLLLAMGLSAAGLNVVGVAVYSLPALGLLAGSFYGPMIGGTFVGLLTVLLPVGMPVSAVPLIASAAGALVCSLTAARMRSREELALLGGGVGLTQGVVYLLLTLIFSPVSPSAWFTIATGAALQGIYGVISSVLALGVNPYLEHLFDLVTPIRLAELANPNRPLLQRLAAEAPGTFQHTLFVASLGEAAARALGCNVELVRTGTLYHDIGKMHDPQGFIENQMGGPNKHDLIDDPWKSATIIKKHVSEGIVMARKCRLPKEVQSFIPEHQGTMRISYFHHQAEARAADDPTLTVKESDFRYDGPIPQSPETGIVMLADSCEAALRSLTDATHEEALAMVNRILRARWKDQQLVESGLTREHLAVIADIFVQVWQQYNHKRIAYPKAALVTQSTPQAGAAQ
ncbi:hypothetical protein C7271_20750 [filamentous cyanobacterium CCP5]|nr:hypothetical protein C7271_20750 [filamentous cyanobacterium CCP5]